MSAKRKNDAAAPAQRVAPHDSAELPAGLVWTMPENPEGTDAHSGPIGGAQLRGPSGPSGVPLEELWADPWAAAKAAGLLVERVVQKCPGRTERSDAGIWKVTPAVLEACGLAPERARAVVEVSAELRPRDLEGAVVYALSGAGRVAVRSCAKAPRSSRVLAQVREPSRLRCGDEVAIRYTESGRAEVIYGR